VARTLVFMRLFPHSQRIMLRRFVPICFSIVVSLGCYSNALGQVTNQTARKFDEFGDIQISELKARLDNFAVQLQNEPNARGFIMVYRSRNDMPGLSHALAIRSRDYLLANRSITKDRLALVDGGVAVCLTQELWIVPPGSAPKPREDARIGYFYHPDYAWKFFEYTFLPPELYERFGVTGPIWEDDRLDAYANEVKKDQSAVACIIVYAQYDPRPGLTDYEGDYEPKREVKLDRPGTALRRLSFEKTELVRTYGIAGSRIRLIDGGYRKRRTVELWIVPRGEHLPISTPNSFPPGRVRPPK
jgi:hypothetical protein